MNKTKQELLEELGFLDKVSNPNNFPIKYLRKLCRISKKHTLHLLYDIGEIEDGFIRRLKEKQERDKRIQLHQINYKFLTRRQESVVKLILKNDVLVEFDEISEGDFEVIGGEFDAVNNEFYERFWITRDCDIIQSGGDLKIKFSRTNKRTRLEEYKKHIGFSNNIFSWEYECSIDVTYKKS